MGAVSQLLAKHNVQVRRGHRDQGIVERFNRTLAERLFRAQYAGHLSARLHGCVLYQTLWLR